MDPELVSTPPTLFPLLCALCSFLSSLSLSLHLTTRPLSLRSSAFIRLLCLCPFAKCVFNVLLIVSSLWLLAEIPATLSHSLPSLSLFLLSTLATQHCAAN